MMKTTETKNLQKNLRSYQRGTVLPKGGIQFIVLLLNNSVQKSRFGKVPIILIHERNNPQDLQQY